MERDLALRQACEKAWGHLVERTDSLFHIEKMPDQENASIERRKAIENLGDEKLKTDYDTVIVELHGKCFYRGRCNLAEVERLVALAEQFPERVKAARGEAH